MVNYKLMNYELFSHRAIFHSCPDVGRIVLFVFHLATFMVTLFRLRLIALRQVGGFATILFRNASRHFSFFTFNFSLNYYGPKNF